MIKIDSRVEIVLGARDATRADLDSLKRRLDELGKRVATAKVNVDDSAAQAKLLLLARRLKSLNERVTPNIDLQGVARAEVQLAAMNAQFDKLGGAAGAGGGILAKVGTLLSQIPVGSVALWAALAAAIALVGTALAPVAAALIPVTAGFAGLAFVAKSVLAPVFSTLTLSGKQYTAALKALDPAQRQAVRAAEPLRDQFAKLSKAVQPEILKAFATGIKIVNQLMPTLKPLMEAAGKAVDAFLKQLLGWLKSPSGQAFLNWLEVQGPADIKTFGRYFWDVAVGIGIAFDHIYRAGKWLDDHFRLLFTVIIPAYLDIWKEETRIAADKIEILFLNLVNAIIGIMARLPGPLGAPFRAARASISQELGKMQADVRNAMGNIQADINQLHGKSVTIQVGEGVFRKPGPGGGYASGTGGAAPGWAWVGERGPELVKMGGGEVVIPNHALQGFADGAMGRLASAFSGAHWPSAPSSLTLAPSFHYTPRPAAAMAASGPQVVVQPVVIRFEIAAGTEAQATAALLHTMRKAVRTIGGGSVQQALGRN